MAIDHGNGLVHEADGKPRCWWCAGDELYRHYHDTEWGQRVRDDRTLFEKICLEGFQSGLSWLTILRKRENFRAAFANFEIEKVAAFTDADIDRCLQDAGIVRHRGKIVSTINNAKRAIDLIEKEGSFSDYVWQFKPINRGSERLSFDALRTLAITPESTALSQDLKKRGWSFVGPTTCYAFMQAMGMVDDHVEGCHVMIGERQ